MLLWRQFAMEWKLYLRDRGATFWTFAFPVLMLLGFGLIFRGGSGPGVTLVWTRTDGGNAGDAGLERALAQAPVTVLKLAKSEAEARWARGETAAQLESTPAGHRLRVNSYLLAQGQTAAQAVQQANLVAQAKAQGLDPEVIPSTTESPGGRQAPNYAAFLLPGLLGLNLLSIGLFSVGMVNVAYREKGKFRRLGVTPLPKWVFLLGQVLQRLTVSLAQSVILLATGRLAFGIHNQGSYGAFFLVVILGTGAFMALGFALSSLADTVEGYGAISNLAFFPMMLLSGVYFTLDAAPLWLQKAVVVLPLAPYIKALRGIFNDGAGLIAYWPGLLLVLLWGILGFAIAVKRFRWT